MDLIAGLNELISNMEEDVNAAKHPLDPSVVVGYLRTLKTLIKAASAQPQQSNDGGVNISVGGGSLPQQPPQPQQPFKGPHRESDPWEEARKRGRQIRRGREMLQDTDPGDED